MSMERAYGAIGRQLRDGHRGHGRHARSERNGAVRADCVVRRVATLLVMSAALLSLVQPAAAQAEPQPTGVPGAWALRLNEEFSGSSLNTALWTPGWQDDASISGPVSGQCLSPANVTQNGNGYLYLQVRAQHATCGSSTVEDSGGLIESNPSDGVAGHSGFSYTYGYVEWRAYVPGVSPPGRGCAKGGCLPDWPALWSLSSTNTNEIDTMEGLETLGLACYHLHKESYGPGACLSGSYASAWHTYGSEWEPGVVKYFYDGAEVGHITTEAVNGTPQYLIADILPPGYGQPLVVPDEMVVDYVRVWQHPVAPSAITGSPTSVQPLQTTLTGTVNPNGFNTHYYFQYGTTTSYGHTEPALPGTEVGAGLGSLPESTTVTGLEPGTTYHYRIIATNAGGTTEGKDEEFKTPGPVEAVTSPASELTGEQVTLNGTVNPRGYNAKYYFEYGPNVGYGSKTKPEGEAGSGSSAVAASALITGLESGTTYHYRLVATSGGVTSYGSDQTFRTLMPKTSIVEWDGTRHVYYRGLNNQLHEWYWNGSDWSQHDWGYAEVAGDPSAVVHSNGSITVYYRNTSGQLAQWWFGPNFLSEWSQTNWGYEHEVASNPSAVVLPNGNSDVYYRTTSGQLGQWWYGANWSSEWSQRNWGYEHEVAGAPSAVAHNNDAVAVYYRSTSGQLGQWWYGANWSSEWSQRNWGYEHEVASNPSAVVLPNGGSDVYYRDTKAQIGQWWFGTNWSSEWSQRNWGYENEVAGTPSAVAHSNNSVYVYYRATNGQLGQWWYGANWSSEWSQQNWGYLSAVGGEPSASALAAGGDAVYYGGTTAQMWEWYIDGSSWKLTDVGAW
jgi:hypothetical protein